MDEFGTTPELYKLFIQWSRTQPKDKGFKLKITAPRNYELLKKYWSFVNFVALALDLTPQQIDHILKLKSGNFDIIECRSELIKIPKSISFPKMTNEVFNEYYNTAVNTAFLIWHFEEEKENHLIKY